MRQGREYAVTGAARGSCPRRVTGSETRHILGVGAIRQHTAYV